MYLDFFIIYEMDCYAHKISPHLWGMGKIVDVSNLLNKNEILLNNYSNEEHH